MRSTYDTLMREIKRLTTNTAQDKVTTNPLWAKDGKCIVYTQEQAKGTDSNISSSPRRGNRNEHTPHCA